jgi:hypothetical protein
MFRVDWLESALDELTTIWTEADSSQRTAITTATHAIDRRLRANAPNEGESRPEARRIMFALPLVVTFQIESDEVTATVLHVRLFRRRGK